MDYSRLRSQRIKNNPFSCGSARIGLGHISTAQERIMKAKNALLWRVTCTVGMPFIDQLQ
jgi:hypothetical protein